MKTLKERVIEQIMHDFHDITSSDKANEALNLMCRHHADEFLSRISNEVDEMFKEHMKEVDETYARKTITTFNLGC